MKLKRTMAALAGVGMALSLTACGSGGGGSEATVADNPKFDSGTTMAKLASKDKITIGVKFDQPGIGFLPPGADAPEGFDIEMGKIVAGKLGIAPDQINWKETVSDNREPYLQHGTVDLVIASYSITDERRQVVGQAGPYYVTGQQLLVREEDKNAITTPEDAKGKKVCSVTGSTSLQRMVDDYGANPVPFSTYSECVDQLLNGTVDALTTDGAILLGYAADDPDKLEVVGKPFSEERYGIGFKKGDTAMCNFLRKTIKQSFDDGSWKSAFESTLGKSGVETPQPPAVDSHC